MSNWLLQIGDVMRPLASWGIKSATLSLATQAADSLSFTADAGLKLAYKTPVALWLDDVRKFWGVTTGIGFVGEAARDERHYEVSGPWWYLDQIIFQQKRRQAIDIKDRTKGLANIETPRLVLFQEFDDGTEEVEDGSAMSTLRQARAAFDYAIRVGAPIARDAGWGIELNVPFEAAADVSCAEILRRCIRWTRDVVTWWDYAAATPTLHIERRSSLTPVELDLDDADTVLSVEPLPRHDLKPGGVRFVFFTTDEDDEGGQWSRTTNQYAGHYTGGPGDITQSFVLGGVGESAEKVPTGLAVHFYNSLSTLQWQGAVSLVLRGGASALGPGNKLNLVGGDAEWAGMAALIQTATEDLFSDKVRLEFGPPAHLGAQDFYELAQFRRGTSGAGPGAGSRIDGTGGGFYGGGGTSSAGMKEITVCDGNTQKTIKVLAE